MQQVHHRFFSASPRLGGGSVVPPPHGISVPACAETRTRVPAGYQLVMPAGRGAFSEIWKLRRHETGRFVAWKFLREEWRDDSALRRTLANEATVCRAVRSRYVVRVEEYDPDGPCPSLLLEWLDGRTLEQRLAPRRMDFQVRPGKGRPGLADGLGSPSYGGTAEPVPLTAQAFPLRTAVWIARQCAQGLHDLADAGYSHGDLKPANVFLNARGEVKLIDLGFSRPIDRRRGRERNLLTGTTEYMAPEVLSGGPIDPVARDLYSLGVLLFRMLCGRLPFEGTSTAAVLRKHREARPPRLTSHRPDVPAPLADLVQRLLAKQPLRRPTSPAAVVGELIALELDLLCRRAA